jgi:hypothetical protein
LATATAETNTSDAATTVLEFIERTECNTVPRSAERVTERNSAAVHVDLRLIEAQVIDGRQANGGESFINFNDVKVAWA